MADKVLPQRVSLTRIESEQSLFFWDAEVHRFSCFWCFSDQGSGPRVSGLYGPSGL